MNREEANARLVLAKANAKVRAAGPDQTTIEARMGKLMKRAGGRLIITLTEQDPKLFHVRVTPWFKQVTAAQQAAIAATGKPMSSAAWAREQERTVAKGTGRTLINALGALEKDMNRLGLPE